MAPLLFGKVEKDGLGADLLPQKSPDDQEMALHQVEPLPGERNLAGEETGAFLHPAVGGGGSELDSPTGQEGRHPGFEKALKVQNRAVLLPPHRPDEIPNDPPGRAKTPFPDCPAIVPPPEKEDLAKGRMIQKKIGAPVFHQPVDPEVRTGLLQRQDRGKGEDHVPDPSKEDNQDGTADGEFGRSRYIGAVQGQA